MTLTYNGGANPPVKVGSYPVMAIVDDANYAGQTSGTLIITSPSTTVTVGNLSHTYDGTPKSVSVATAPPGLNVTVTYNGNATPPVNADSYQVVATVNDPNYSGQAIDTMVISKAPATVALSNLSQTYNGTPRTANASTSPGGLNVALTYDGVASPPANVGDYQVVATIIDANYNGQTTGTLVIRSGNQPPTISVIPNQQTHENTMAGPIPFAISDDRTDAASLTLDVVSSDTTLIPPDRITIGGSDAQRSLTILPGDDKFGTAQITVRVTDADGAANETSFNLTVRLPSLSIADVVVMERDDGDADACILVTLSAPSRREVSVSFSTADDTAKDGADYRHADGTLVFKPQSGTFPADPGVSAMLVTSPEITRVGNNVLVTWPRLLDRAVLEQRPDLDCSSDWERVHEQPVQTATDFRLMHDGAAAQRFYRILPDANFRPAEVSKRITVKITGDRIFELDKHFFIDLFNPDNAEIEKGRAICTIVDQDPPRWPSAAWATSGSSPGRALLRNTCCCSGLSWARRATGLR